VANPNKPRPIVDILLKNRDRLINYLEHFGTDKKGQCISLI
jgi:calcium binding protein 39